MGREEKIGFEPMRLGAILPPRFALLKIVPPEMALLEPVPLALAATGVCLSMSCIRVPKNRPVGLMDALFSVVSVVAWFITRN